MVEGNVGGVFAARVDTSLRSISNQHDGMVEGNVGGVFAARVDTSSIGAPPRGVYSNSQGTHLSQMLHHGVLVVSGQSVVSGQTHDRLCVGVVIVAGVIRTVVGHVIFSNMAKQLDISEAELRDGSLATSSATTVGGVRGATSHLLGRKGDELIGGRVDGSVGLDELSGGEGPAGPTAPLVLGRGDHSLVPPVHRVRQLGPGLRCSGNLSERHAAHPRSPLVSSRHRGLELFLSEVRELVDCHLPGGSRPVVVLNLGEVLLEDAEPKVVLCLGVVLLSMFSHER